MQNPQRPYHTVIPIQLPIEKLDRWGEAYAELAKQTNADLFVIVKNIFGDKALFRKEVEELRQKAAFFHARGVTLGAWLCPTTGHEGMGLTIGEEGKHFTHRQVADYSGEEPKLIETAFCPLDENFKKDFA